jgi:hypothetical protein
MSRVVTVIVSWEHGPGYCKLGTYYVYWVVNFLYHIIHSATELFYFCTGNMVLVTELVFIQSQRNFCHKLCVCCAGTLSANVSSEC